MPAGAPLAGYGTAAQGAVATAFALIPPVVLASLVWWAADSVHPLLGVVWNAAVLYLLMGFRRFSHAVSAIVQSLNDGDVTTARRALAGWRGGWTGDLSSEDVARLSIERGLFDAYRQVFAVLFWFIVLPGPMGAVLYRAAVLLADEWRGSTPGDDLTPIARSRAEFGRPAQGLLALLDWVPVRLTALSFAIVGDFEDAAYCWRMQAKTWPFAEGGEPIGIDTRQPDPQEVPARRLVVGHPPAECASRNGRPGAGVRINRRPGQRCASCRCVNRSRQCARHRFLRASRHRGDQ